MNRPDARTTTAIVLNGEARAVRTGSTVEEVVHLYSESTTGFAVARNGEVVPRGSWTTTALLPGDRVDVLTVAPGG